MSENQSKPSKYELERLIRRVILGQGTRQENDLIFDLVEQDSKVSDLYTRSVVECELIERAVKINRGNKEGKSVTESRQRSSENTPKFSQVSKDMIDEIEASGIEVSFDDPTPVAERAIPYEPMNLTTPFEAPPVSDLKKEFFKKAKRGSTSNQTGSSPGTHKQ